MKKLLEIYCLGVCFGSLTLFSIFLGCFVYQIFAITVPEFTSTTFKETSPDVFLTQLTALQHAEIEKMQSEGKLTEQIKQNFAKKIRQQDIERERRLGYQNLLKYFIVLIISAGVFIPHWRFVRKCFAENRLISS